MIRMMNPQLRFDALSLFLKLLRDLLEKVLLVKQLSGDY